MDYNIQPLQDKTLPESVKVVQGDVTSADSWKKAMTTAIDSFGSLNVVCNNAGIVTDAKVSGWELSEKRVPCRVETLDPTVLTPSPLH